MAVDSRSVRLTLGRQDVISADEARHGAAQLISGINDIKGEMEAVAELFPAKLAGKPTVADLARLPQLEPVFNQFRRISTGERHVRGWFH